MSCSCESPFTNWCGGSSATTSGVRERSAPGAGDSAFVKLLRGGKLIYSSVVILVVIVFFVKEKLPNCHSCFYVCFTVLGNLSIFNLANYYNSKWWIFANSVPVLV